MGSSSHVLIYTAVQSNILLTLRDGQMKFITILLIIMVAKGNRVIKAGHQRAELL